MTKLNEIINKFTITIQKANSIAEYMNAESLQYKLDPFIFVYETGKEEFRVYTGDEEIEKIDFFSIVFDSERFENDKIKETYLIPIYELFIKYKVFEAVDKYYKKYTKIR